MCFAQRGRVTRYLARGLYLETLAHYEEYVLMPLVVLARLIHTPRHTEYGWTHITRHLPEALSGRFAALCSHRTLSDLPALLERLAQAEPQQNAEFINIFYGEDVDEAQAQSTHDIFQKACPNAEITLLSGGQPVYYYMISAE